MAEPSDPGSAPTTIVARTSRDVIGVHGPDAVTYLQGQLSQDVASMTVGDVAWTFVLAPQGKVEGWGRVARTGDEAFEVVADAGAGGAWEARLRRFLLRTRAEVAVAVDVPAVAVRGGRAADVVVATGDPRWRAAGWPGLEGFDLVDAASSTADLDLLAGEAARAGAVGADADALEAWRIRAGIPVWGAEIDGDTIPATLGQWAIDASVSFTKGCYTGQELVARIDSRGGNVPRLLHVVEVAGPAPDPGTPLVADDGSAAGEVTSSAADGGGSVALAFVPRGVEVPDDGRVVTVGGVPGILRRLPG